MLCVICLRNKSDSKAVCGDCQQLNLPNCNKQVEDIISKRLMELPSHTQIRIIKLTHKRFQSLLEYNLSKEFCLNLVLKEYMDMESKNDDLEMAMDTDFQYVNRRSYNQYKTPKKEQL